MNSLKKDRASNVFQNKSCFAGADIICKSINRNCTVYADEQFYTILLSG